MSSMSMVKVGEDAQALTDELLEWAQGKDPMSAVPALLVTAAKIGVAAGHDRVQLIKLLTVAFTEEYQNQKASKEPN